MVQRATSLSSANHSSLAGFESWHVAHSLDGFYCNLGHRVASWVGNRNGGLPAYSEPGAEHERRPSDSPAVQLKSPEPRMGSTYTQYVHVGRQYEAGVVPRGIDAVSCQRVPGLVASAVLLTELWRFSHSASHKPRPNSKRSPLREPRPTPL